MKKVFMLATAALLIGGMSFAAPTQDKKKCCKKGKSSCCKKGKSCSKDKDEKTAEIKEAPKN
jgi:hypothetical protein